MTEKYEIISVPSEEKELFYSSLKLERDRETGCIGHLRADFGRNGDEFWNTWENHFTDYKTQAFKDEFDSVINSLRNNGILKNRAAMSAYCSNHQQAKIAGESDGKSKQIIMFIIYAAILHAANIICTATPTSGAGLKNVSRRLRR